MIKNSKNSTHSPVVRTFALIAAILIGCMYIATLVLGLFFSGRYAMLFRILVALDIIIPVCFYGYLIITRYIKNRTGKSDGNSDISTGGLSDRAHMNTKSISNDETVSLPDKK